MWKKTFASALVVIVLVSVVAVIVLGNLLYTHYESIKKMKLEAQMELSEAEAILADTKDALNPTPPSMLDLIDSLEPSEEYLTNARTAFDYDRYEEASNLAETAREIAEEVIMGAKRRVEGNIQTFEEEIKGIENLDNPPRSAALLLEKAQNLLDNAKVEYENKKYGLAQESADVGKTAVDNAMRNIEKVENAERKVERIEELKRTFEQELGEFIAATLEEVRKQLENARELPDEYLSSGSAENAKKLSENMLQRMSERALEEIIEAEKAINLVENMMYTSNYYSHAVTVLVDRAKEIFSDAREAYEEEKYGQAFGQAHAAKMLARNVLRILEEKLEEIAEQENYIRTAVAEVTVGSLVDTTPPTIHRVWVEPTVVTHGEVVIIYISVTDDLSGIDGLGIHVSDAWGRIQAGVSLYPRPQDRWRTPSGSIEDAKLIRDLGQISENVWYYSCYVKEYTPTGIWTVRAYARDEVGNRVYLDNIVQFTVVPSEIIITTQLTSVPQEIESGENFSVLVEVNNTINLSLENIVIYSYLGDLTLGVDEVSLEPYENKILVHSAVLSDVEPGEYIFGIIAMYEKQISEAKQSISVV